MSTSLFDLAGASQSSDDEDHCFLGSPGSPGTSSLGGSGYEDAVELQDGGSEADEEQEVSTRPQVSSYCELNQLKFRLVFHPAFHPDVCCHAQGGTDDGGSAGNLNSCQYIGVRRV